MAQDWVFPQMCRVDASLRVKGGALRARRPMCLVDGAIATGSAGASS